MMMIKLCKWLLAATLINSNIISSISQHTNHQQAAKKLSPISWSLPEEAVASSPALTTNNRTAATTTTTTASNQQQQIDLPSGLISEPQAASMINDLQTIQRQMMMADSSRKTSGPTDSFSQQWLGGHHHQQLAPTGSGYPTAAANLLVQQSDQQYQWAPTLSLLDNLNLNTLNQNLIDRAAADIGPPAQRQIIAETAQNYLRRLGGSSSAAPKWSPLDLVESATRIANGRPAYTSKSKHSRRGLSHETSGNNLPLVMPHQEPMPARNLQPASLPLPLLGPQMAKVNFDDSPEFVQLPKYLPLAASKRDYMPPTMEHQLMMQGSRLASLPKMNTQAAATTAAGADDEAVGSLLDTLLATSGNRYAAPAYYATAASYPMAAYQHHHHHPYHPYHHHHHRGLNRKGLEKSLGLPVLVGIGAGLISFLVVSNLFLSLPLLAMTIMHLFNGSGNLVMPPNNNQNNNNNNSRPPQNNNQTQPATGKRRRRRRRKRELQEDPIDWSQALIVEALQGSSAAFIVDHDGDK